MQLIYTNENSFLVSHMKNIVENKGINVFLKNEFAAGGSGELAPLDTWVELWVVDDADYDRAMAVIENARNSDVGQDWVCCSCGEENAGSFDYCWHCQKSRSN